MTDEPKRTIPVVGVLIGDEVFAAPKTISLDEGAELERAAAWNAAPSLDGGRQLLDWWLARGDIVGVGAIDLEGPIATLAVEVKYRGEPHGPGATALEKRATFMVVEAVLRELIGPREQAIGLGAGRLIELLSGHGYELVRKR